MGIEVGGLYRVIDNKGVEGGVSVGDIVKVVSVSYDKNPRDRIAQVTFSDGRPIRKDSTRYGLFIIRLEPVESFEMAVWK